jgi:copper chaperone
MLFGKKETLEVRGMSCSHCEQTIIDGLAGVSGVDKVKANHKRDSVTIYHKDSPPDMEQIRKKVIELGFEV